MRVVLLCDRFGPVEGLLQQDAGSVSFTPGSGKKVLLAAVDVLFEVGKSAVEKSHRIRHAVAGCFGLGRTRFLIVLEGRLQGRFGLFYGQQSLVYVKILIVLQGVSQAKNEDSELIVGHPTEYNLLLFAGGGDLGGKEVVARGFARSDFFFQ